MRIGLVIDTPERMEKYMISVDQFQWEWSMSVHGDYQIRNLQGELLYHQSDPPRYEKRITTTFSGLLLPYPPLPGVESKD